MRAIAFNGSPRPDGNTAMLLGRVLEQVRQEGIATELIQLPNDLKGCTACYGCFRTKDGKCAMKGDQMNEFIAQAAAADAIILGSPTYFANVTSQMKAFIDRLGFVGRSNNLLSRKIGAAVASVRRAGAMHAIAAMNNLFFINQMIVPGSIYWNMAIGRDKGDVARDEEGMNNMVDLGKTVGWLVKKLRS